MLKSFVYSFLLLAVTSFAASPNFIIIFTDDQGYGDLGCFGSKTIKTPRIDQLAEEGRRMTSFYVASSVCTPSRAALMTGSYPKRVGLHQHVLFPQSKTGLHPAKTTTIADVLSAKGYATACVGKWHLGHHPETLPTRHGFDSYFGIPYSNDMSHPDNKRKGKGNLDDAWTSQATSFANWNAPLIRGEEMIEVPVDQRTITRRYTDEAIKFIRASKDKPFFLYLAHSMPHIPLFVPDDVADPDPKKAYINVIEHIDSEVGRISDILRELKLDNNTYLIFTTDNGPWLRFKHHGGSAGPLRDGKGTTYEGGQRVPCVVWAPGRVPAGTESNAFASTMDLLPTIASLADAKSTAGIIDGFDISGSLTGDQPSPRNEMLFYSSRGELEGIRSGDWKLLNRKAKGKRKATIELYNLTDDLGETTNLASKHPDRVKAMTARMAAADQEISENAISVWKKPS